jgi:hypothetical protein
MSPCCFTGGNLYKKEGVCTYVRVRAVSMCLWQPQIIRKSRQGQLGSTFKKITWTAKIIKFGPHKQGRAKRLLVHRMTSDLNHTHVTTHCVFCEVITEVEELVEHQVYITTDCVLCEV